jgi:PPOX class probable F420-dependent enzyme
MSRRDQIRMSDAEVRNYLARAQTLNIISINKNGTPHPMPMWYAVEPDGAIAMTTFTKSQKVRNIERDPRVTLLVEDGDFYGELRGVVIYGVAELVRDRDRILAVIDRVGAKALADPRDAGREAVREAVRGTAPKRTAILIRPERILSWDHRKLGGVY